MAIRDQLSRRTYRSRDHRYAGKLSLGHGATEPLRMESWMNDHVEGSIKLLHMVNQADKTHVLLQT